MPKNFLPSLHMSRGMFYMCHIHVLSMNDSDGKPKIPCLGQKQCVFIIFQYNGNNNALNQHTHIRIDVFQKSVSLTNHSQRPISVNTRNHNTHTYIFIYLYTI